MIKIWILSENFFLYRKDMFYISLNVFSLNKFGFFNSGWVVMTVYGSSFLTYQIIQPKGVKFLEGAVESFTLNS